MVKCTCFWQPQQEGEKVTFTLLVFGPDCPTHQPDFSCPDNISELLET